MKSVSAERRKPLTRSSLMRDNEFSLSLLSDVLSYEATLELALLKQIINDFKHIISTPVPIQANSPICSIYKIPS